MEERVPELGSRFEVVRQLGRGSQSVVWLAHDRRRDEPVAVRLLERPAAGDLRREFALLGRLRHPGIAAALELLTVEDDRPAVVSEYIDGLTFDRYATDAPPVQALDSIGQLLGTLDFVHRRDLIHRDIKPDNVLVSGRRVALVDFGLAVALGTREAPAGTVGYIAPEVLAGDPASARSDLYSVGVMLYELLFGRSPFARGERQLSAGELIRRQHETEAVLPPGQQDPALRRLVAALLARTPDERPPTAAAALDLLEQTRQPVLRAAVHYLFGHGLPEPRLVGRDPLIAQARRTLRPARDRAAQDGSGAGASARTERGLLILGRAGKGRSRVADEIAALAQLAGIAVIRQLPGGAHQPPARLPAERPGDSPGLLGALAIERALAALRAHPALRAAAKQPGATLDDPSTPDTPTALLVFDEPDDRFAGALLERIALLDDLPLQLCITATPDSEVARRLRPLLQPVQLAPLDREQVGELVASVLPASAPVSELAGALHRLSGGNAALATDLLRATVHRWLGDPELDPTAHLAALGRADSGDPLRRRCSVAPLDRAQRELACFIALFRQGIDRSTLRRALPSPGRDAIVSLLLQHVIEERPGQRLAVRGELLRRTLLARLSPEESRALAQRAMEILAPGETSRIERAQLAVAGGQTADQLEGVVAGARAASAELRLELAVELFGAAIHAATGDHQARLRIELARLLVGAGRFSEAAAALEPELQRASDRRRAEATELLADALLRAGAHARALDALDRTEPPPELQPRFAVLRGKVLLFSGAHRAAGEAVGPAVRGADDALAAEALHVAGLSHYYRGELQQARERIEEALGRIEDGAPSVARARIENSLGMVCQRQAAFDEAQVHYRRCLAAARQLGHLPFQATFAMNLGSVAQQRGDFTVALEGYRESLSVARRFAGPRELAQVRHNLGRFWARLGQFERARSELGRSRALALRIDWATLAAQSDLVIAEIDLACDELPAARDHTRAALSAFIAANDPVGRLDALLGWGRYLLARDMPASAARIARGVRRDASELGYARLEAELLAAEAGLADAGASASIPTAGVHLEAAARLAAQLGGPDRRIEIALLRERHAHELGDVDRAQRFRSEAAAEARRQLERLPRALRARFAATGPRRAVLDAPGPRDDAPKAAAETGLPRDEVSPANLAALDRRLLGALLEINHALTSDVELQRLLERIIDRAVELAGAERGLVLLRQPDPLRDGPEGRRGDSEDGLAIEAARNFDRSSIAPGEAELSRSLVAQVLESGQPVVTVDAQGDARFREFLSVHHLRLRSLACVPLVIAGSVRGVLYVDDRFGGRGLGPPELQLLGAFADQAALAIRNWELLEQNRRRQQQLERQQQQVLRLNEQLERAVADQAVRLDELSQLADRQRSELERRYRFSNIIGQSPAIRELFGVIDRVKDKDAPVLIRGESGTGKELVAKALHFNSERKEEPFVAVNCGALQQSLLESELFGYERGAFTGADRQRRGLFERSDGGTLFLDEVGEMGPDLQVKLLRVLQERRFTRLGGESELSADFRLLAATNRDLRQLVDEGTFRLDLYYRIDVIALELPPLRERSEDIPLLLEHLLHRHGGADTEIAREALKRLMDYRWPGNVRELENEVLRLLALGGKTIRIDDLSPRIAAAAASSDRRPSGGQLAEPPAADTHSAQAQVVRGSLREEMRAHERKLVSATLSSVRGNVTEAARRLGMSRVGLHKLLRRHGLGNR